MEGWDACPGKLYRLCSGKSEAGEDGADCGGQRRRSDQVGSEEEEEETLVQAASSRQKRESLLGKKRSRSRSRKKKKKKKRKSSSSSQGSQSEKEEESSSDDLVAPLKKRSRREPGSVFSMLESQAAEHLAQDGVLEAEDPKARSKARMYSYCQQGLRPMLNPQSRDCKEISMLAGSLDFQLPDWWHYARHLEIQQAEEDGPVPTHVLLQAQRHGRRVDKAGGKGSCIRSEWSASWRSSQGEKGKGKGKKGKTKKGKDKGKGSGWSGNEKEKGADSQGKTREK